MSRFIDDMQALSRCVTAADTAGAALKSLALLNYDGFCFATELTSSGPLTLTNRLTTWSEGPNLEYNQRRLDLHDPVLAKLRGGVPCIDWHEDAYGKERREREVGLFNSEAGRGSGQAVSIVSGSGGRGVLFVSRPDGQKCDLNDLPMISLLSYALLLRAERNQDRESDLDESAAHGLSATQLDILRWIGEGKSNGDVAAISGLSRRNVDYHVGQILAKLGVASRMQAVAWLVARREKL